MHCNHQLIFAEINERGDGFFGIFAVARGQGVRNQKIGSQKNIRYYLCSCMYHLL